MTAPPSHVVVVGASLAGLHAVRGLRRRGFSGRIVLVGAEHYRPYDRPPLSKEFLWGRAEPTPYLIDEQDWDALDVDARLGVTATSVDRHSRRVALGDEDLSYDALVIATGLKARQLPGRTLPGVHTLRGVGDARNIREAFDRATRLVVVGAGFIGAEVASAARRLGVHTTILEAAATPLRDAVGPTAGAALARLHARHGVELHCDTAVSEILGGDRVAGLRLADGSQLAADLVVVGIGAIPETDWLAGSGLDLNDGVLCDATLKAADGVWAAGDIARWPNPTFGTTMRLEHWTNAMQQGDHVAANLLDPEHATEFAEVPYFWSQWYSQFIQCVGMPIGEPALVVGDWDAEEFVALYRDGERLVGALTLNRRRDIMRYRRLIGARTAWDAALAAAHR